MVTDCREGGLAVMKHEKFLGDDDVSSSCRTRSAVSAAQNKTAAFFAAQCIQWIELPPLRASLPPRTH